MADSAKATWISLRKSVLDRLCRWLMKGVGATTAVLMRTDDRGVTHVEAEYQL